MIGSTNSLGSPAHLLYHNNLTRIASGEDLNDYVNYGSWALPQNAIASSVSNVPVASAGVLVVRDGLGTASAYRTQTYYTYDGDTYIRWKSSGNWSAWQKSITDTYFGSFKTITNIQEIPVNTSTSVANNATGTLTGTLSNTGGSGTWYFIPVYFNFGFATAKPTLSGTTLSVTVMNSSGASHTLAGRIIAMRVL